jgi:hypothetical protein
MTPTARRFIRLQDGSRVLVRWFRGKPGFEVRWTDACNGCSEYVDGYLMYGPSGCNECGYTGKRVRREWVELTRDERRQLTRKALTGQA